MNGTTEKSSVVGNAAKMREALEELRDIVHDAFWSKDGVVKGDVLNALRRANVALSAPSRNCDKYETKDEAREAFQKLRGHRVMADVSLWDDRDEIENLFDWLFATATKGVANEQ